MQNHQDMTEREQRIRELAEFLWIKAGRPSGQDERFWLETEAEVEIDAVDKTPRRTIPRDA